MKKEPYNGWYNRDTWLVSLWLNNEEPNYRFMTRNKTALLKLKKPQLISALKRNCKFGDKINWTNVSITEVKRTIRES